MTSPMPTWQAFYKEHNGQYSDKLGEIDEHLSMGLGSSLDFSAQFSYYIEAMSMVL